MTRGSASGGWVECTNRAEAESLTTEAFGAVPCPMGMVELLEDGDLLHIQDNAAACDFFGVPPGASAGRRASELSASQHTLRAWVKYCECGALTGESARFEHVSEGVSGPETWLVRVTRASSSASGRRRYFYIAENITQRKQAEADALAARAELDAVACGMSEGLVLAALDGSVVRTNPTAARLLGYASQAELSAQMPFLAEIWDIRALDGQPMARDEWPLARLLRGQALNGFVVRWRRRDTGLTRTLSFNGCIVQGEGGEPQAVLTFRDVTDLMRIEEELRHREHELQTLADNTPDILSRIDRELRHVFVNAAVQRVTGKPPSAFIGRTNRELGLPSDMCELWDANLLEVFATRSDRLIEFSLKTAVGQRFFECRLIPEFGPTGEVEHVLCVAHDVTEAKRAEEALRAADRKKDEFLATLAHELRNPLAPIRNAAHLLKAQVPPSDPKLAWGLEVVERQVRNMARLLEDLLDVSRITRDKLVLRTELIDLGSVIESAVETSRPALDASQHQLQVRLPSAPVLVDADPVRLAQVFSNLLNNAARYTPDGGCITLSVEERGPRAAIVVRDNGIGIPREALPTLFEIFSQAAPAGSRSQGGLGIGLSLVKGLVRLHGGSVSVKSDGPGCGSEFTVELPVAAAASAEPVPRSRQPLRTIHERVLVVDDNTDSADSLAMFLEMLGCEVRTAYDGEQALQVAEAFHPSVMLLDIGMPGLSGIEVCERLRQQAWGRAIFLIATTGWGQAEDRRQTRAAGFQHHLVKPVDPAALTTLLAERRSQH